MATWEIKNITGSTQWIIQPNSAQSWPWSVAPPLLIDTWKSGSWWIDFSKDIKKRNTFVGIPEAKVIINEEKEKKEDEKWKILMGKDYKDIAKNITEKFKDNTKLTTPWEVYYDPEKSYVSQKFEKWNEELDKLKNNAVIETEENKERATKEEGESWIEFIWDNINRSLDKFGKSTIYYVWWTIKQFDLLYVLWRQAVEWTWKEILWMWDRVDERQAKRMIRLNKNIYKESIESNQKTSTFQRSLQLIETWQQWKMDRIDEIWAEKWKDIESAVAAVTEQEALKTEFESKKQFLEDELRYFKTIWYDEAKIKLTEEKIKDLEYQYWFNINKSMYEYAVWKKISTYTKEQFDAAILSEFWVKWDIKVTEVLNQKQFEKYAAAVDAQKEIMKIQAELQADSEKNMVENEVDIVERTLNASQIFITDFQRTDLTRALYWEIETKLDAARAAGTPTYNDMVFKISKFNQLKDWVLDWLTIGVDWKLWDLSGNLFYELVKSSEFQNLREAIFNMNKTQYTTKEWDLREDLFAEALRELPEFKIFRDLMWRRKRMVRAEAQIFSDKQWMSKVVANFWWVLTSSAIIINDQLQKAALFWEKVKTVQEDILWVGWLDPFTRTMRVFLWESIYENELDSYIKDIKRENQEYAQNPRNTMSDSVWTAWKMLKANPAWNVAMAVTTWVWVANVWVKTLRTVKWLAKMMKSIDKIWNPIWRNLAKATTYWITNTIEWLWANLAFDTFLWNPWDDLWYWILDPVAGYLSIVADIANWTLLSRVQKEIKLLQEEAAKTYAVWWEQYHSHLKDLLIKNYSYWFQLDSSKFKNIDFRALEYNPREIARILTDIVDNAKLANENVWLSVTRSMIRDNLKNLEDSEEVLDSILYSYQKSNFDLYSVIKRESWIIEDTKTWVLDKESKIKLLSLLMNNEKESVDRLAQLWLIRLNRMEFIESWFYKKADLAFNDLYERIKAALITATPEQTVILNAAKKDLDNLKHKASILPFYLYSQDWWNRMAEVNSDFKNILENLWKVVKQAGVDETKSLLPKMTPDITELLLIPDELKEAIGDPEKLAKIIYSDLPKYKKFWVMTYDLDWYLKYNEDVLVDVLWDDWFLKLQSLIKTIDSINWWKISIVSLPNNMKDILKDIIWFSTHTDAVWWKDKFIIWVMWTLANAASKWESLKYIETLSHELWHNIMLSLKSNVKDWIIKWIKTNFSFTEQWRVWEKISSFFSSPNPERVAFLENLYKTNKEVFFEEISADMLAEAIVSNIFWKPNSTELLWQSIYENLWKSLTKSWQNSFFDLLATKFNSWLAAIFKYFGWKTPIDVKKFLYMMAYDISNWQKYWSKDRWIIKRMKTFGFLSKSVEAWWIFDEAKKFNSADEFVKSRKIYYHWSPDFEWTQLKEWYFWKNNKNNVKWFYFTPDKNEAKIFEGTAEGWNKKTLEWTLYFSNAYDSSSKPTKEMVDNFQTFMQNKFPDKPEYVASKVNLFKNDFAVARGVDWVDLQSIIKSWWFDAYKDWLDIAIFSPNQFIKKESISNIWHRANIHRWGRYKKVILTQEEIMSKIDNWTIKNADLSVEDIDKLPFDYQQKAYNLIFKRGVDSAARSDTYLKEYASLKKRVLARDQQYGRMSSRKLSKSQIEQRGRLGEKELERIKTDISERLLNWDAEYSLEDVEDIFSEMLNSKDDGKRIYSKIAKKPEGVTILRKKWKYTLTVFWEVINQEFEDYYDALRLWEILSLEKRQATWELALRREKFKAELDMWEKIRNDYLEEEGFLDLVYNDLERANMSFILQEEWDKLSTAIQWVDKTNYWFAAWELYSLQKVRYEIINWKHTAESLWDILPLSFFESPLIKNTILEWLPADKQRLFIDAVNHRQDKHRVMVGSLLWFFDEVWNIDNTKKINWLTFAETLNNIWYTMTRNWALDSPAMDFIKFSDIDTHDEFLRKFINDIYRQDLTEVEITRLQNQLKSLWFSWNVWDDYVEIVAGVREKIRLASDWILSAEDSVEMARDITSRLFIWWPWYIKNILTLEITSKEELISSLAYWIAFKNKKYSISAYKNTYNQILENLYILNWADEDSIAMRLNAVANWYIPSDTIKYEFYERTFYNMWLARTDAYILKMLNEKWWSLPINIDAFVKFVNKVSREKSIYTDLILRELWLLKLDSVLDFTEIAGQRSKFELLNFVRKILKDSEEAVKDLIWNDNYNDLFALIKSLEEDWISDKQAKFLLAERKWQFNSYKPSWNMDTYFNSVIWKDEIDAVYKENLDALETSFWKPSEEYNLWKASLQKFSQTALFLDIEKTIDEFNNMLRNSEWQWIEQAISAIFEDKSNLAWLKTMLDIKWWWTDFILNKTIKKWWKLVFNYDAVRQWNESKNFFVRAMAKLVNPATVWKYDNRVVDILYRWKTNSWEWLTVWSESALESYLATKGITEKSISKSEFLAHFVEDMSDFLWKWLKTNQWDEINFQRLSNDIVDNYKLKFETRWYNKVPKYALADETYKLLVDSYVEVLWERGASIWRLSSIELANIFSKINEDTFWNKMKMAWTRQIQVDKLEWLRGTWISLSKPDIEYLKSRNLSLWWAVFDNFLYNTHRDARKTYWFLAKVFRKWYKKWEEIWAKLQYASFYNIFFTWMPAAFQQLFTNRIKLMANVFSEIWYMDIDAADKFLKLTEDIYRVDVTSIRAELATDVWWEVTKKSRLKKFWAFLDNSLSKTSALAWSDESVKNQVNRYSLIASLNELWYSEQWADEMIRKFITRLEAFEQKWYWDYIDSDALFLRSNDYVKWKINLSLSKSRDAWKISELEAERVFNELMDMRREMRPAWELIEKTRINTQVFYQISSDWAAVSNIIAWNLWQANMRFFNWASRKSWEYIFQLTEAILQKDMPRLAKYTSMLALEAVYASKYYLMMNNASRSDWKSSWLSYWAFMSAIYLPAVLFWMISLKLWPALIDAAIWRWFKRGETDLEKEKELMLAWWNVFKRIYDSLWIFTNLWLAKKPHSVLTFWSTQMYRIIKWLSWVDNWDLDWAFSTSIGLPIAREIIEMFWNVLQSRISRFDTATIWWYNTQYMGLSDVDSVIWAMFNQKVSRTQIDFDKIMTANYKILNDPDENSFWVISFFWYGRDKKFEIRSMQNYIRRTWINQFIAGWPLLSKLFTEWENNSDFAYIQDYWREKWIELSDVLSRQEQDAEEVLRSIYWYWAYWDFQVNEAKNKEMLAWKNKLYSFVSAFLNPSKWWVDQKELYYLWWGSTPEEVKLNVAKFDELVYEIQQEATANPHLLKSIYNTNDWAAWKTTIKEWLNEFWESIRLLALMEWLTKANRDIISENNKRVHWKDWQKTKPELKGELIEKDADFKKEVMLALYPSIVQANRTLWKALMITYINSDKENRPFKRQLKEWVWIWVPIMSNYLQKTITAQWLNSVWIDNKFSEVLWALWYHYNWADNDKKPEKLDKIMWLFDAMIDFAENTNDSSLETNIKVSLMASSVWFLSELRNVKNPELWNRIVESGMLKMFLDRVTVSDPLEDDVIKDMVRAEIFNEPWAGSRARRKMKWFSALKDKINKFWQFKTDFYRYVLNEEPLQQTKYSFDWVARLNPVTFAPIEIEPRNTKINWIKMNKPEELKTKDLTVATIATTRVSWKKYTWKAIKWWKIYVIKTTRWTKKK